jgi:hypothetical protein
MPPAIATSAFPTFAQARDFLLLPDGNTDGDERLASIITGVGQFFENYTGRRLKLQSYVDAFVDGTGFETLFLPEYPIVSITKIRQAEDRNFDVMPDLVLFDEANPATAHDVVIVNGGESGEIQLVSGGVWFDGPKTVRLTYSAGYEATANSDITLAQLILIADYWNIVGRDPSLVAFGQSGISKTYAGARGTGTGEGASTKYALPPKVLALLEGLKRASFEQ